MKVGKQSKTVGWYTVEVVDLNDLPDDQRPAFKNWLDRKRISGRPWVDYSHYERFYAIWEELQPTLDLVLP